MAATKGYFDNAFLYTLILSFWGQFLLNYADLLLSNRPVFPEAREPPPVCKFQELILSDGKKVHIIRVSSCMRTDMFGTTAHIWVNLDTLGDGNSQVF